MTIQALYTAATGMSATQTNLDVIANNLANASTTGFKESRMNFADLCYQNYQLPGSLDTNGQPIPIGMQVGTGVRTNGTEIDQTQGSFIQTNGTLDMAISGLGFFQIQDPQSGQILYTRAGNFAINANGQVVLASPDIGRFLQPTLTIPPGAEHHDLERRRGLDHRAPGDDLDQYRTNSARQLHQPPRSDCRRSDALPGQRCGRVTSNRQPGS